MGFGERIATVSIHSCVDAVYPFSVEPVFQQWPVIPTADSAWIPIATSFSVAMDTQTIHTHVE